MFSWLTATSKPRRWAGAISVMYIGQTTEAAPTATPPSHRKNSSAYQSHARAQPAAATRKSTARQASTGRRPHQSAGRPTSSDPTIVPSRALETVKPSRLSVSEKTWRRDSVVPEITAVSNPNRNEPSAATIALSTRRPPPERDALAAGALGIGACMTRHRGRIKRRAVGGRI